MKVEVGKFYKTRDGRQIEVKSRGSCWPEYKFSFNLVPTKECSIRVAICDENGKNPYNSNLDLIEEWKEPEVKEPKFKVGDRVRPNEKEWVKNGWSEDRVYQHWNDYWLSAGSVKDGDIFYVNKVDGDKIGYSNKPNGIGPTSTSARFFELVETKPEIIVGSRWTNIGKESKTVTVVHINDKYVTFEHDGRETIGSTTVDRFHKFYAPYVKPPKSLVGYVGVIDDGDYQRFTLVCESEEEVRSMYTVPDYNIVAIKKIEWTEGE